jgi:hypothetical protein
VDTLTGVNAKATRTFEALDGLLERVIAEHRQRRVPGGRLVGDGEDDQRDFVDVLLDVNEMGEEAGGVHFDEIRIKAIMLVSMFVCSCVTHTKYGYIDNDQLDYGTQL